jgi:hypothetical protein
MDPKSQKPSRPFANPFSLWTEFAFKLWGFGKPASEKQVAVAVIPTSDARVAPTPKRANAKVRRKAKLKSKRTKR